MDVQPPGCGAEEAELLRFLMPSAQSDKTPQKPIPDFSRLSYADTALLLKLADDGRTQMEIATVIGCSQPTVSQVLSRFGDTRDLAKKRMNSAALKLVDRVIEDADVDQSLEVLDRIGVAEKRLQPTGADTKIAIVIGMPGQAVGPDPLLTVSTSEHRLGTESV